MKSIRIAIITILLSFGNLFAQNIEGIYKDVDKMDDWGFSITPYALLAAQSTDVGGEKLRQSFSDLSSMTNTGFQLVASARYKKLVLSFDGTFATLGTASSIAGLDIDATIKQRIIDLKSSYIIYENFEFVGDNVINGWSLDIGVGAKYWKNDVGLNYTLSIGDIIIDEGSYTIPQQWWDLMVGIKTRFVLNDKVRLAVGFNVGGFGIGNSSKFAYDFTYINNFRVLNWMSVNAGFRSFNYSRVDGEGQDEVSTKVNVLGPLLGVSFIL